MQKKISILREVHGDFEVTGANRQLFSINEKAQKKLHRNPVLVMRDLQNTKTMKRSSTSHRMFRTEKKEWKTRKNPEIQNKTQWQWWMYVLEYIDWLIQSLWTRQIHMHTHTHTNARTGIVVSLGACSHTVLHTRSFIKEKRVSAWVSETNYRRILTMWVSHVNDTIR